MPSDIGTYLLTRALEREVQQRKGERTLRLLATLPHEPSRLARLWQRWHSSRPAVRAAASAATPNHGAAQKRNAAGQT